MKNTLRRACALCVTLMTLMTSVPALAVDGEVNTSSLILRKSASKSSRAIQTLQRGDDLDIQYEKGDWYKVVYGKYSGFVMKKYVKAKGTVPVRGSSSSASSGTAANSSGNTSANTGASTGAAVPSNATLRKGSTGSAVKALQTKLKELGFYTGSIDGVYGNGTRNAVKSFQRKKGLSADGVAGAKTLAALNSAKAEQTEQKTEKTYKTETLTWFGNENRIPKGAVITVKDCYTGKTFRVKRWAGSNHLDGEPLTASDTATMKSVYGGSWSWKRRPILVMYNDHVYAASMNGMPHGTSTISNNNFAGHFCIHFTGSRTHESNKVDSDHQNAIKTALRYTW